MQPLKNIYVRLVMVIVFQMYLKRGQFIVLLVTIIHYTIMVSCHPGGLSMILYLQVPECISKLPDPDDKGGKFGSMIVVVM